MGDVGEMGGGGDAVSCTDSGRGDTDTPDGEIYTDNTGTDLTQFIISTLNKNTKDRVLMLKLEQEMSNLVRDAKKTHHKFPHMSSYHRDQDTQWQTEVFRSSIIRKLDEAVRKLVSPTEINAVNLERQVFQRTDSKEEYLSFVARLILYVRQQADGQDSRTNFLRHFPVKIKVTQKERKTMKRMKRMMMMTKMKRNKKQKTN